MQSTCCVRCIMLFCSLLLGMESAWAEIRDLGPYSVEIPAQWTAEEELPDLMTFTAPDQSCVLNISLTRYHGLLDAKQVAQDRAADWGASKTLRALPEAQGFAFAIPAEQNRRGWISASGNWAVEIHVSAPHKDVPILLRSLRARDEHAELAGAFAPLAESGDALAWLSFSAREASGASLAPFAAVMPDFSSYGLIKDAYLSQPKPAGQLPKGWELRQIGMWLVAVAGDGKHWAAASVYPVAAQYRPTPLLEVARALEGKNVLTDSSTAYFVTPAGYANLELAGENSGLVQLFSDQETLDALFGFAKPADR